MTQTTYSNGIELLEALKQQSTHGAIQPYFTNQNLGGDNETNGVVFIHTKLSVHIDNKGKKHKTPSYLKKSNSPYKFSHWKDEDAKKHEEALENDTSQGLPLINNCMDWVILLNNERKNYTVSCIDCDSVEELYRLYEVGFPVFDTPFTLSSTKRLPHFYIKMESQSIKTTNGHHQKPARELDWCNQYMFEHKKNKVYGKAEIPTYELDKVSEWLDLPYKYNTDYFEDLRNKDLTINKGGYAEVQYDNTDLHYTSYEVGLGASVKLVGLKITPQWDTLPLDQLQLILSKLPVEDYTDRKSYFTLCCCVVKNLNEFSDPNDYIDMVDSFYKNSQNYSDFAECPRNETFQLMVKYINSPDNQVSPNYLLGQIKKHDKTIYDTIVYGKERHFDKDSFTKLSLNPAITAFNKKVSYVGGSTQMFMEYNPSEKSVVWYSSESKLKESYKNLYYTRQLKTINEDGEEEVKSDTKPFIKAWLESTKRKEYRGVDFRPPPLTCHYDTYNLYDGFDGDKVSEWNDEFFAMSKENIEAELQIVLGHLWFLSGDDNTQAVYDYQLRFFCHLLKYPAVIPRVYLVWISEQGTGKNQWLNFIAMIIGWRYYYSTASQKNVLGDFNDCVRNKFLVNLNEFRDGRENIDRLKELTTEINIATTEKNKSPMTTHNCVRVVISSNNDNCISQEESERRQVVIRPSTVVLCEEFKEAGYFADLHTAITSKRQQCLFLHYARHHADISEKYDFSANRPITQETKQIQARSTHFTTRFLRYLYSKNLAKGLGDITTPDIWGSFKEWKNSEGERVDITKTRLLQDLDSRHMIQTDTPKYRKHNKSKVLSKRRSKNQIKYRFEKERTEAYLESKYMSWKLFLSENEDEEGDSESDCESD